MKSLNDSEPYSALVSFTSLFHCVTWDHPHCRLLASVTCLQPNGWNCFDADLKKWWPWGNKKGKIRLAWWHLPAILAHGRIRSKSMFSYIVSLRPTWAAPDSVLKQNNATGKILHLWHRWGYKHNTCLSLTKILSFLCSSFSTHPHALEEWGYVCWHNP
jgi:hypothetical protein